MQVLMSYGRNRWAEEEFFEAIRGRFTMHDLDAAQLDDTYQTMDVRALFVCQAASSINTGRFRTMF